MEYRTLGRSGLKVSVLTMGTMTFGGAGNFAKTGNTDLAERRRQIDLCLDTGVNLIDTANVYSRGLAEEIVGEALGAKRSDVLIASKVRFRMGDGPNDEGLSRHHVLRQVEAWLTPPALRPLDILYLHEWDGQTPLEETLSALDALVAQGKVRYVGASNYSAWHLMKALAVADARGFPRLVTQQIHYTLEAREAEYELVPDSRRRRRRHPGLEPDRRRPALGQVRPRSALRPPGRRLERAADPRPPPALAHRRGAEGVAADRGVSGAQVALAWLLGRPGVASLVIGGRSEEQFRDSLAAADLALTADERARLDAVSAPPVIYPYWHQN